MAGYSIQDQQNRIDEFYLKLIPLVSILIFLFISDVFGGEDICAPYWVYFKDKGYKNRSELNLALHKAEANLSQRNLKRRLKINTQQLVDYDDLAVNSKYINDVSKITGANPRCISRWLNAASFSLTPGMAKIIAKLPFVSHLRPVRSFIREREELPSIEDAYLNDIPDRDDHRFDYGSSYTQNAFVNLPELHDRDYLGEGVLIGITDTGFDNLDHNCFGELDIVAAWDFLNDDDDVNDGDDQGDGSHGTKTLSIIAGFDPDVFIGAAPQASFVLAKTECTDWEREVEEDYWVEAIEWMDELGVEVVSVSLSYMRWYDYEDIDGETGVTTIAANRATDVGMVIVVSMGNNGRNRYPDNKLGVPSDGFDVFAIGATSRDSSYTSFSAKGPTWDNRIKPDFTTFGSSIRWASSVRDDWYGAGAGTSFSTPVIAGLCALLIQINPAITPQSMREVLREVSHNSEDPDTLIGWGIPDALAAYEIIHPQNTELVVPLENGWNLISKNLFYTPEKQITEIFRPLLNNGSISLVRNGEGHFYSPGFNFNNIPFWNDFESYHVRMTEPDTLVFSGIPIDFTQPIPLNEGWQNISYLPGFSMSAEDAMISLVEEEALILVKDGDGNFYLPDQDFCDIPDMEPSHGFQICLSDDAELVYPRRRSEQAFADVYPEPKVFRPVMKSFSNMSILLLAGAGINDYDEIGCFDTFGNLIGSGLFLNEECGVAVWGENQSAFPEFKLFQSRKKTIVEPKLKWISGSSKFKPNTVAVIEVSTDIVDDIDSLQLLSVRAKPDPFNSQLSVEFETTSVNSVNVLVYDLMGRLIENTWRECDFGGSEVVTFNASNWSAGSYIVCVESGGLSHQLIVKHLK